MRNWNKLRERYLRDALPIRLGGIAANMARVKSFSESPDHQEAVADLLEESKYFIEWAVPSAALETQAELVELQIQLALWQHTLGKIYPDL